MFSRLCSTWLRAASAFWRHSSSSLFNSSFFSTLTYQRVRSNTFIQLTNLGKALCPYAIRACVGSTCGGGRVVTRGNAILFISVAID